MYVHIPFCVSKCRYCDFVSRPAAAGEVEPYLDALRREISEAAERGRAADTIYFGGGTPSLLTGPQLAGILDAVRGAFRVAPDAEISLEANPGTLTPQKALAFRSAGVNRVSLGIQSFDDAALERLGRRHRAAEAVAAWRILREAGFGNLGIDLMHSLPGQRPADWRRDLERALALGPEHLSLYGLILEEGTGLADDQRLGSLALPTESDEIAMFTAARELTAAAGFQWYEISNHARPGFGCRHNQACWGLGEYRGFGVAAHSFQRLPEPVRFANTPDVGAYVEAIASGGSPVSMRDPLSPRQLAGEALMLGLRTRVGVDVGAFTREHGAPPEELFPEALSHGSKQGWLEQIGGRLRLTPEGVLLSNNLFSRLF